MKEYKATITKEIIQNSDITNIKQCIGANILRTIFPKDNVGWGRTTGSVIINHETFYFKAVDDKGELIDMMGVTKPQEVTLKEITAQEYKGI